MQLNQLSERFEESMDKIASLGSPISAMDNLHQLYDEVLATAA